MITYCETAETFLSLHEYAEMYYTIIPEEGTCGINSALLKQHASLYTISLAEVQFNQ